MAENVTTTELANALRVLAVDGVEAANSGHPGMPMGMADVTAVLFKEFVRFNPADPAWADRDRFVLSAGHGSMLLYALHYCLGTKGVTLDDLKNFRQLGSRTAGHPEVGHFPGVEVTTGPLGQGIATAVGLALGERMAAAQYGADIVDHRTFVIAGDGCLMEGISHEAAGLAGHLKLGRLIVLFDDNGITIDGSTSLSTSEDTLARFDAYKWHTLRCDGHDPASIKTAIEAALADGRPSLIACRTTIGKGSPNKAGSHKVHGAPLGKDEAKLTRETLGLAGEPFFVPAAILDAWRSVGARSAEAQAAWAKRLAASPKREAFEAAVSGKLPATYEAAIAAAAAELAKTRPTLATRVASAKALEAIIPALPALVGGSADLTPSNNTFVAGMGEVAPGDFAGRYIHFGIREFGMTAALNGLALHGGFIPYGGTFLVFTDYARPALRLAALMGVKMVFVGTHDSIGLGEDGPTHQPVEHLLSMRAIPGLNVFRPADAIETLECWDAAIRANGPSVLALSRQNLKTVRPEGMAYGQSHKGAYVLADVDGKADATVIATGSEVEIAMAAREKAAAKGLKLRVVSMPSWELFDAQPADYRAAVLGTAPRYAIEAASPMGWSRYVGSEDNVIGIPGFGASGKAEKLYEHFGITADAIVAKIAK
jgi:transketolase